MYCLFLSFYVLFLCKCVLYYCHRVTTQLQLTNISYHIISDVGKGHSRESVPDMATAVAKCYKGFLERNVILFVVLYGY